MIQVYTSPTCYSCKKLKTWLNENNVEFSEVDLTKDMALAQTIVAKTGNMSLPQASVEGEYFVGYDQIIEKVKKCMM